MRRNKQYTAVGRKVSSIFKNQRDLAEVLGLTQQSVSGKLTGKIAISIDDLEKISEFTGYPVAWFFLPDHIDSKSVQTFATATDLSRLVFSQLQELPADLHGVASKMIGMLEETNERAAKRSVDSTGPAEKKSNFWEA